MTKTIKSLKDDKPYNGMLARQESEIEIATIPIKKNQTLEVTSAKLSVHNSKKIIMSVPIDNVRSISPLKKDRIKIQYYEPKLLKNGDTIQERKYSEYRLDKNEYSANHICRKIQKEHERLNTRTNNQFGFLMVHGWESIIDVYHDIKTNEGTGLFYVTNAGLALETDDGIVFDVPYEYVLLVTNHKKKVRILWQESWNSKNNFQFDFQMNGKTDSNVVRTQINDAFESYRTRIGYEFITLEQKYGKIGYDEMFNLIKTRNPEFEKYIKLHVRHTFGYSAPKFDYYDSTDIMNCKFAGVSLDVIKNIPEEEAVQRKESLEFYTKLTEYNKKDKELYDIQLEMESQCKDKDSFVTLKKSKKYDEALKALDDLKTNHGIPTLDSIDDFDDANYIHIKNAINASDARTAKLYKKWTENVPLIDCTDEYDDTWMNYLLEKLNCEHCKVETFGSTITFDTLKDKMKIRDRNVVTLSSFVPPENIPAEDIYNNCWHDKANKIWYVYDDNLSERLQNNAISDPDHSQGMIGRRVWGFSEDQIVMFEGFPSLYLESNLEEDILETVTTSRETGRNIQYLDKKMRHFILPILKEDDITPELMNRFGSFVLQTEAMLYSIESSGGRKWMTPKMNSLWVKKHNFPQIPIAERTGRAFCASKTGSFFSVQAPLEFY